MTPITPITDVELVKYLVELGRKTAGPQTPAGASHSYVIGADGDPVFLDKMVFNDNEKKLKRIEATVEVNDAVSFIDYYQRFSDDASAVFANESTRSVKAILDYHERADEATDSQPRHCKHRLNLNLPFSDRWKTWIGKNNEKFTQQDFAEFLEQFAIDIASPPPAHMVDVARDLQATTEVEFSAGVRTQDGQTRFKYTETTKSSMGNSQMDVPDRFRLEIPVFQGGAEISIEALLRFRVNQGKLVIWYTLIRPDETIRQAFLEQRNTIATGLSITILNGAPSGS